MSVREQHTSGAGLPGDVTGARGRPSPWRVVVIVLAIAALVTVLVVVTASCGSNDNPSIPVTMPSTTLPQTTTTQASATTVPTVDTTTAVYPAATASIRFDDPVQAARQFAVDFVGFVNPVVGAFQAGDSQSGEVEVRPAANGPVTTVMVRRIDGKTWWVLGAATRNIALTEPAALASVASPVRLRGTSTAFEAQVNVEVREDGVRQPIGTGTVMGGSMGQLGPFDGTVTFTAPSAARGALVLFTISMKDGSVNEASVVRVAFAGR